MTEADLLAQLEKARMHRRSLPVLTEEWATAGYEVARLSEAIRRVRWEQMAKSDKMSHLRNG